MGPDFLLQMRSSMPLNDDVCPSATSLSLQGLTSYNQDFLNQLLNWPVYNKGFYSTTVGYLINFLERCGCEVILRGSATLKLLGIDNLKKLAGLDTIPEEIERLILEQINTPLNDIDLHFILPSDDPQHLELMRNNLIKFLSMTSGASVDRIQQYGLEALLTWRGLPTDQFEIITLAGGIDIVLIAQRLSRPRGVFARDIALKLNRGIPELNEFYGGGIQAVYNLFRRVITPAHPEHIAGNDWARAVLHMIKGYDLTDTDHEALVNSAKVESSLALIEKRHFVHSENALPVFHLQALISLYEMGKPLPEKIKGCFGAKASNFQIVYEKLQAAVLCAYAKGSKEVSITSLEAPKLRFKVSGYSCIIKMPAEVEQEPVLTKKIQGELGQPRACAAAPNTSLRLQAARELSNHQTAAHQSHLPRMILDGEENFEWVSEQPKYQWLKLDHNNLQKSIFESLLNEGAYFVLYGLLQRCVDIKLKGEMITKLYTCARELAVNLFLSEKPSLKMFFKVHRWICREPSSAASQHLQMAFIVASKTASPFNIPAVQESVLVEILKLLPTQNRIELLMIYSKFMFESGYEFAQLCEEHFSKMSLAQLLLIWDIIKSKFNETPKIVLAAKKTDFRNRFEQDPENTYLSLEGGDPVVLRRLIKTLLDKKEFQKAQIYALKLGDQKVMRIVAQKSPASRGLAEFMREIRDEMLDAEVRCIEYLGNFQKITLFKRLLMSDKYDEHALQLITELSISTRTLDLDLLASLYLRNNESSRAIALFKSQTSWQPSTPIADRLARVVAQASTASRLYKFASNEVRHSLVSTYKTSSVFWFCRYCSTETPSNEDFRAIQVSTCAEAKTIYDSLRFPELKSAWRTVALESGILLPGVHPDLLLLKTACSEQRDLAWELCRPLVTILDDYPEYIQHMSAEDVLALNISDEEIRLSVIARLLDLGEFSTALDRFIEAYLLNRQGFKDSVTIEDGVVSVPNIPENDPRCVALNTFFMIFIKSGKLTSAQKTKLAHATDPLLCFKDVLFELFIMLSKTESNDRYLVEILEHLLDLIENNQSKLLKNKSKEIKLIAVALTKRIYLSKNEILVNKLVDFLFKDTFVDFIRPKDIVINSPEKEPLFYLLHLLMARCDSLYIKKATELFNLLSITMGVDKSCFGLAAHLLLVAAASSGDESQIASAITAYLQCLENKIAIPPETGVHTNALAVIVGYTLATNDVKTLSDYISIAWEIPHINIVDILNTINRILKHGQFKNFATPNNMSLLLETMCRNVCLRIARCNKEEFGTALKIAKTLLLLVFTMLPVNGGWATHLFNLREAILKHEYPTDMEETRIYVQMLSYPIYQNVPKKISNAPKMGLDIITRLIQGPTNASLCFALLHMGLNLQFFADRFGEKHSCFLGNLKYCFNQHMDARNFQEVVNDLKSIVSTLELPFDELVKNVCLMMRDIHKSSYEAEGFEKPINETSPAFISLWRALAGCTPNDNHRPLLLASVPS